MDMNLNNPLDLQSICEVMDGKEIGVYYLTSMNKEEQDKVASLVNIFITSIAEYGRDYLKDNPEEKEFTFDIGGLISIKVKKDREDDEPIILIGADVGPEMKKIFKQVVAEEE